MINIGKFQSHNTHNAWEFDLNRHAFESNNFGYELELLSGGLTWYFAAVGGVDVLENLNEEPTDTQI